MTSDSRIISEIERAEEGAVTQATQASNAQHALKIKLPLLAEMQWERLFESANPPGALPPQNAKFSLTREAIRRKEAARKARRSGYRALARLIA